MKRVIFNKERGGGGGGNQVNETGLSLRNKGGGEQLLLVIF